MIGTRRCSPQEERIKEGRKKYMAEEKASVDKVKASCKAPFKKALDKENAAMKSRGECDPTQDQDLDKKCLKENGWASSSHSCHALASKCHDRKHGKTIRKCCCKTCLRGRKAPSLAGGTIKQCFGGYPLCCSEHGSTDRKDLIFSCDPRCLPKMFQTHKRYLTDGCRETRKCELRELLFAKVKATLASIAGKFSVVNSVWHHPENDHCDAVMDAGNCGHHGAPIKCNQLRCGKSPNLANSRAHPRDEILTCDPQKGPTKLSVCGTKDIANLLLTCDDASAVPHKYQTSEDEVPASYCHGLLIDAIQEALAKRSQHLNFTDNLTIVKGGVPSTAQVPKTLHVHSRPNCCYSACGADQGLEEVYRPRTGDFVRAALDKKDKKTGLVLEKLWECPSDPSGCLDPEGNTIGRVLQVVDASPGREYVQVGIRRPDLNEYVTTGEKYRIGKLWRARTDRLWQDYKINKRRAPYPVLVDRDAMKYCKDELEGESLPFGSHLLYISPCDNESGDMWHNVGICAAVKITVKMKRSRNSTVPIVLGYSKVMGLAPKQKASDAKPLPLSETVIDGILREAIASMRFKLVQQIMKNRQANGNDVEMGDALNQGRRGGGHRAFQMFSAFSASNRAGNSERLLNELGSSSEETQGRRGGGGLRTQSTFSFFSGNRAGNSEAFVQT